MIDPTMQRFHHCGRAGEVHVRHPQRNHVPAFVLVPLDAARAAAVYRRVKSNFNLFSVVRAYLTTEKWWLRENQRLEHVQRKGRKVRKGKQNEVGNKKYPFPLYQRNSRN
jgi:hypothetical protein